MPVAFLSSLSEKGFSLADCLSRSSAFLIRCSITQHGAVGGHLDRAESCCEHCELLC